MSTVSILLTTFVLTYGQNVEIVDTITGSNQFGFGLESELYSDASSNIWISPFCITSCFSLIYPGSGGNTQTQIADTMGYPTTTSNPGDVTQQFFAIQRALEHTYNGANRTSIIGIANKIYASNSITLKQAYINALYDSIRTEWFIETGFDFSSSDAATIINQWVSDSTNGLIDSIMDPSSDYTGWTLAALNAIYLNASFQDPFDADLTSQQKFYTDSTRSTEASDIHLMHQVGFFPYFTDGDYQFLKFSFTDSSDLFALFVLPINHRLETDPEKHALITDPNYVQTAVSNLQRKYIALALPKLSITAEYELKYTLQDMGITEAFDENLADLTGIAEGEKLLIDTVIHKTMVEMDEEGLVAAAVTVIGIGSRSGFIPPQETLFKADHPFQMFIIDGANENAILFMGQINDPGIPAGSASPTYVESVEAYWTDFSLYGDRNVTVSTTMTTTASGESEGEAVCDDVYVVEEDLTVFRRVANISGNFSLFNVHMARMHDAYYLYYAKTHNLSEVKTLEIVYNVSWILVMDEAEYVYIDGKNAPFDRQSTWYLRLNQDDVDYAHWVRLYLSCDAAEVERDDNEDSAREKVFEFTSYIIVAVLLLIAVLLVIIAFCVHRKKRGADRPNYIAIIRCFIEIIDIYTDVSFIYSLYLNGEQLMWYLVPSILVSFAYILSIITALIKIGIYKRSKETVIRNYMCSFDKPWFIITLIVGFYATFDLLSSHLFHLNLTSFQAPRKERNHVKTLRMFNFVLIENLGMLICQTLFLSYRGYFDGVYQGDIPSEVRLTLLAMCFSVINIIGGCLTIISRCIHGCATASCCCAADTEMKHFYLDVTSKHINSNHAHSHFLVGMAVSRALALDTNSVETLFIVAKTKGIQCKMGVHIANEHEVENYEKLFSGIFGSSETKKNLLRELKESLKIPTIKDVAVQKIKAYGDGEEEAQSHNETNVNMTRLLSEGKRKESESKKKSEDQKAANKKKANNEKKEKNVSGKKQRKKSDK